MNGQNRVVGEPKKNGLSLQIPAYPSIVPYVDDFTDESHSFRDFDLDEWALHSNGSRLSLNFEPFAGDAVLKTLIKLVAAEIVRRGTAGTARLFVDGVSRFLQKDIIALLESRPHDVRPKWDILRAKFQQRESFVALKSLLKFAAEYSLGFWTPLYIPFIASSLPLPPRDKYAAVRAGDVFLSICEEAILVQWIYRCANEASKLSDNELSDAALIICGYQFAMRPKQIGILRRRDCRVLQNEVDHFNSVHLNFRMIKQRTAALTRMPLVRKVKREWTPIFLEINIRGNHLDGDAHLVGHESAATVSARIAAVLFKILSVPRSATHLRHSGAMRQVDAGASAEELAEFMGHSTLESGLVYYDASPTQSERVNQAMGISETYQRLALLGKERFITRGELASLKGDQQIGGVPHGMPITGIGGCETGQPSCPYNPVTACYGCPKFMPVSEINVHKQVLAEFRGVVKFFYDSSRGESESPAYLQLKRTIAEVNAVIDELESENE